MFETINVLTVEMNHQITQEMDEIIDSVNTQTQKAISQSTNAQVTIRNLQESNLGERPSVVEKPKVQVKNIPMERMRVTAKRRRLSPKLLECLQNLCFFRQNTE